MLKTRKLICSFLILLLVHTIACASVESPQGKFTPADGEVLLIIGQDKKSIQSYVKEMRVMPAGFSFYTSVQDIKSLYGPSDVGGGVQDFNYLIHHYPHAVIQVGLYMVGALEGIVQGTFDENINALASRLKDADRPIYLRIGYEFDNPENSYDPALYVAAYRYIVDKFREKGVKNVAFVWHAHCSLHDRPITDWYPGDDYVDWVGISYFNPYNTDNMDRVASFAEERQKPLMIAEATPVKISTTEGYESWQKWFEFVFKYIEEHNVKAFCYINCDWDKLPLFARDEWGNARLEVNHEVKNLWLEKIRDKKFLNSSLLLWQKLRY